jgi:transcriptional regulator with XRE-family HTH domain
MGKLSLLPEAFPHTECGHRLAAARLARKLSQGDAAKLVGCTRQYISWLENGSGVMDWNRLVAYVDVLGLDWKIVLPEAYEAGEDAGRVKAKRGA